MPKEASAIWKHFVKVEKTGGICNHCQSLVSSKDGTSNLHSHLLVKHALSVTKKSNKSVIKGQKLVNKFSSAFSATYQAPQSSKESPISSKTPVSLKTQLKIYDSIKKQFSFQSENFTSKI